MKGEELREMQAQLKARYREAPEAAIVTLRAAGEIGDATLARAAGHHHDASHRRRLKPALWRLRSAVDHHRIEALASHLGNIG